MHLINDINVDELKSNSENLFMVQDTYLNML